MGSLTTGEIADRAGVNTETLRYYERRELIPEPPRSEAGYRQYSEEDVKRLLFIKRAQRLGFTLQEVQELLSLRADPGAPNHEVKQRTEKKIDEVASRIRDLERIKATLGELAAACDGEGTTRECPILQAIEAPDDDEPERHTLR